MISCLWWSGVVPRPSAGVKTVPLRCASLRGGRELQGDPTDAEVDHGGQEVDAAVAVTAASDEPDAAVDALQAHASPRSATRPSVEEPSKAAPRLPMATQTTLAPS